MVDRLKTLMHRLTDHTVLADLLDPVSRALARVRQATVGRTLTMPDFIALGVLRHLQGMATLEAKLDDPDGTDRPDWTVPLFRYTAKVSRQVLRFLKEKRGQYPFPLEKGTDPFFHPEEKGTDPFFGAAYLGGIAEQGDGPVGAIGAIGIIHLGL